MLGVIPKTPLFDAATWAAELVWAHLVSVKSGANLFNGVGYAPLRCDRHRAGQGQVGRLRDQELLRHVALAFTPTWYQVFPGVDLSAADGRLRAACRATRRPSSAATRATATTAIGLGADVYQKYRFDLKYIDYFGAYQGQRHRASRRRTASPRC